MGHDGRGRGVAIVSVTLPQGIVGGETMIFPLKE